MTAESAGRPGFIHRYPILSFCVLAIALGAGAVILVVQGGLPAGLALAAALSASLAGIILTAVVDGGAGLRLMLDRLLLWRAGIGYWLFALLFPLAAVVTGSLANPLFGGDPIVWNPMGPPLGIVPLFIAFFVVAGLGQELGWTGFLVPRLQARYSALAAAAIRALVVGIWHLPLLLYATGQLTALSSFPYQAWIAQKGFLVAVVTLGLVFLLPWSIFLTWVFNNTGGSLLLASILHASEIGVATWMLSAGINPNDLDNYWGYGAVLVLAAIAIVVANGPRHLSRHHQRIAHQPSRG